MTSKNFGRPSAISNKMLIALVAKLICNRKPSPNPVKL